MIEPTNEYLPGTEEAQAELEPTPRNLPVVASLPNPVSAKEAGLANFLASAYANAGTLKLTTEESKALMADFPDEAFRTGAAGKENMLYIEHTHLRNRMDEVLGLCQWSFVPVKFWNEDYKTLKNRPAVRVYCEGVLIIRGVYITGAVGDMSYYPDNAETNYGDAYAGSQTACLRRCLEWLGVGRQAWLKSFVEGWFARRIAEAKAAQNNKAAAPPPAAKPAAPVKPAPAAAAAPAAPAPGTPAKPEAPKMATANTRAFVLDELDAAEGGAGREHLTKYLRALGWLDADKEPEQWPYRFVPIDRKEIDRIKLCLGQFDLDPDKVIRPYQPHGLEAAALQAQNVNPVNKPAAKASGSWADYPMPTGKQKGQPMGKVPVAELEFLWANFVVRETVEAVQPDGSVVTESVSPAVVAKQQELRTMLDMAGRELQFKKNTP